MTTQVSLQHDGNCTITEIDSAHKKIKEQQEEIINLKQEKIDLLNQIRELCLSLENKGNELNEFIHSYEKKTLESARYQKELNALTSEFDKTSHQLAAIKKSRNISILDAYTQTSAELLDALPASRPQFSASLSGPQLSSSLDSGNPESLPSTVGNTTFNRSNLVVYDEPGSEMTMASSECFNQLACHSNTQTLQHRGSSFGKNDREVHLPDKSCEQNCPTNGSEIMEKSIKLMDSGRIEEEGGQISEEMRKSLCQLPPFCWTPEHVICWLSHYVGMSADCVKKAADLQLDGPKLSQLAENKFEKLFGLSELYQRKKLSLALEDLRVHGSPGIPRAPGPGCVTTDWLVNYWLPHYVGLRHLATLWHQKGIDGRLVGSFPELDRPGIRKETSKLTGIRLEKKEALSLVTAAQLLRKFNFDIQALLKRRELSNNTNMDPIVWSNERVAKWLSDLKLEVYLNEIDCSGLHGAYMVYDSSFTASTLVKALRLPASVAKSVKLEEHLNSLIKPARLNEQIKLKRSSSIFRSKRRSSSHPRMTQSAINSHQSPPLLSAASMGPTVQFSSSSVSPSTAEFVGIEHPLAPIPSLASPEKRHASADRAEHYQKGKPNFYASLPIKENHSKSVDTERCRPPLSVDNNNIQQNINDRMLNSVATSVNNSSPISPLKINRAMSACSEYITKEDKLSQNSKSLNQTPTEVEEDCMWSDPAAEFTMKPSSRVLLRKRVSVGGLYESRSLSRRPVIVTEPHNHSENQSHSSTNTTQRPNQINSRLQSTLC